MPVVRRFSPRIESRRKARSPQWKSRTGIEKKTRPTAESTGLPRYLCSGGMAPRSMVPAKRLPITRS